MSRYRLRPARAEEAVLRDHCGHARLVWKLAVEQPAHWHPGRESAPGYLEQCRQLTAARAEHDWLRAGSQIVQQQALRDFAQAMAAFFDPQNPAGNRGRNVRAKAGLNREILRSGWGLLVRRLADKAPGRVEEGKPRDTSQRCAACGQGEAEARARQA